MERILFTADAGEVVTEAKAAVVALQGLDDVLGSVAEGVKEAFTVKGYKDYLQTVHRFGKNLADELLVLQLAFGKMKVAIAQAVSPIAEVFVPMINDAIFAVIRFSNILRQFFAALVVGVGGNASVAESAQLAADGQTAMAKAATAAGKAARRSLMSFDQLNRLAAPTGGGGSGTADLMPDPETLVISPQVQALVDKILALLEPLRNIDLNPLITALGLVRDAFVNLGSLVAPVLEWLWFEILTPFAAWVVEVLAPALVEGWAAGLNLVSAAIAPVLQGMQSLWEGIGPIVEYISTVVMAALEGWKNSFRGLSNLLAEKGPQIQGIFSNVSQAVSRAWEAISPVLESLREGFRETFSFMGQMSLEGANVFIQAMNGISQFLVNVFSGNWQSAWESLTATLQAVVNGIIGLLNGMLSRLGSALNSVISAANRLSFTIPDWVPGLGGKRFSVNMSYVSVPQIPYLAQGAVLPANKPFLAMVGDQRHGTNIEAPLETIQQAVAVVMEDMIAGNMAGHQATVDMLRQILEAVLGITIGDEAIAKAVDRHRLRTAMLTGY